eukprot:TRINITY_DN14308_c0_g1_i1.p1 TRINITY_DN14308_c0_g1~~TRINITY_DN14308_c0_g1_i1.p1  ORF type:complete len:475 (+),score=69.35 TRINITY_DN14308_c0_g1_i1:27-1427(+)
MEKYEGVLEDAHRPVVAAFGQILEVWMQLGLRADQVAARGRNLEQKVVSLAKQLLEGEQKHLEDAQRGCEATHEAVELLALELGEGCPGLDANALVPNRERPEQQHVQSRRLKKMIKRSTDPATCSDCSSYSYSDDELPLSPTRGEEDETQSFRAPKRSRSRSPAVGARAKAKAKGRSCASESSCYVLQDVVSPFDAARRREDVSSRSYSRSRSRSRRHRRIPDGHGMREVERHQRHSGERFQPCGPQNRIEMCAMPHHARPDTHIHETQWANSLAGSMAWTWTRPCYGGGVPLYPLQQCSMPQVQHGPAPWQHCWHSGLQPHNARATEGITTLAVRNVPSRYSQEKLLKEFDPDGIIINLFYVPFDSRREKAMGFAFANFWTPQMASTFLTKWNRQRLRNHGRNKYLTVVPATLQGLEKNLLQFTEKGVERMQKTRSLPDIWERPGCRADFVQVLRNRGLIKCTS